MIVAKRGATPSPLYENPIQLCTTRGVPGYWEGWHFAPLMTITAARKNNPKTNQNNLKTNQN